MAAKGMQIQREAKAAKKSNREASASTILRINIVQTTDYRVLTTTTIQSLHSKWLHDFMNVFRVHF